MRDNDNKLQITRTAQPRQPRLYLQQAEANDWRLEKVAVASGELPSEFMMNALRLRNGVSESAFVERTGVALQCIEEVLTKWRRMGCMQSDRIALTPLGVNALDTIVADFI